MIADNKIYVATELDSISLIAKINEMLNFPDYKSETITYTNATYDEQNDLWVIPIGSDFYGIIAEMSDAEVQERFPELIENYELVDNIPTYEAISICSEHQTPDADCERCNVTIEV